ncbi:MAG: hypothetical protein PHI79_03155 [Sulfurovaceae bacterium]|nr:hypothetical protein [Sulfurovaceae bacterium]MDD5548579.1 hypothetical protein [Sulfurovaceae bacterium]
MSKIFFVIAGMSVFFTGCFDDDSAKSKDETINHSDNSAKVYDPCEMLTSKDIQEIFPGANIKITTHDKEAANPLGMRRCYWEASEGDMKFVQLTVSSDAESKAMKVDKQFENNRQYIQNVKSVSEIGDGAYYGGSGLKLGAGLHVLVKNKGVLLGVQVGLGFGNSDEQKHLEIEKSLAEKVVQRL